jgi:hypothetical protein
LPKRLSVLNCFMPLLLLLLLLLLLPVAVHQAATSSQ